METFAFIGAGKMASAMVHGLIRAGVNTSSICCTCGNDPTGPQLAEQTGIRYEVDIERLLQTATTVILACKPQQLASIPVMLNDGIKGRLLLSILAGVRTSQLAQRFPTARNHIRAMPNTPGQIGHGITAFCSASVLSKADREIAFRVFDSLGETFETAEENLDAVTAVSGSGPAYVFEFTSALTAAAVDAGLPKEIATRLARKTIQGAARLMEQTGEDAETLRNNVTSPGGTTQAALDALAENHFRRTIRTAVSEAKRRSIELSMKS